MVAQAPKEVPKKLHGLLTTNVVGNRVREHYPNCNCEPVCIDVPFAKKPSTGTAQQRPFLVLKVVLYAVVVI